MWYIQNQNELYHYGILGMKWGVRRYQNADGTLTEAGKRRYMSSFRNPKDAAAAMKLSEKYDKERARKKQEKRERKEAVKQRKSDVKNRRTLSDAELNKKIERLQKEKQLKDLTNSQISAGKREVTDMLKQIGKKAATTVATGALLYGMKYAAGKASSKKTGGEYKWNTNDFANAVFNGGPKKK